MVPAWLTAYVGIEVYGLFAALIVAVGVAIGIRAWRGPSTREVEAEFGPATPPAPPADAPRAA